jgi:hypothetical protein
MAFLRGKRQRARRARIRALTPAALELSGLLGEIGDDPAGPGGQGASDKRARAAALARLVIREAEELRWDPSISEEFRAVLAHTRERLEDDPRVRAVLRETPPPAGPPTH